MAESAVWVHELKICCHSVCNTENRETRNGKTVPLTLNPNITQVMVVDQLMTGQTSELHAMRISEDLVSKSAEYCPDVDTVPCVPDLSFPQIRRLWNSLCRCSKYHIYLRKQKKSNGHRFTCSIWTGIRCCWTEDKIYLQNEL